MTDIKSYFMEDPPHPEPWVIVGWFTPDYRDLAKKFADNLINVNAKFCLYAVEDMTGKPFAERTRTKPEIVLKAMADFPGNTIILMDIDCVIKNSSFIDLYFTNAGEVGISIKARPGRHGRAILTSSSRVVVFPANSNGYKFAHAWAERCANPRTPDSDDENCLLWAYLKNQGIQFSPIPPKFAGLEQNSKSTPIDAVVVHVSENTRRTKHFSIRQALKNIEKRFFRTGKTRRWMQEDIA